MATGQTDVLPEVADIDPGALADLKRLVAWQCKIGHPPKPVPVGKLLAALDACGDLLDALALSPAELEQRLRVLLPEEYQPESPLNSRLYAARAMLGLLDPEPTNETPVPNGGGLLLGDAEVYNSTVRKKQFRFAEHLTMRKAFVVRIFGNTDVSGMKIDSRPVTEIALALSTVLGLNEGNVPRTTPVVENRGAALLFDLLEPERDEALFVPRPEHASWLRKRIRASRSDRGSTVLWGSVGSGKSTLAKEVGRELSGRGAVAYIDASDPHRQHAALREVLDIEGVAIEPTASTADVRELVGEFAPRFGTMQLLIVDHADLESVAALFPRGCGVPLLVLLDTVVAPLSTGMLRIRPTAMRRIGDISLLEMRDLISLRLQGLPVRDESMVGSAVLSTLFELFGAHVGLVSLVLDELCAGNGWYLEETLQDLGRQPLETLRSIEERHGLTGNASLITRTRRAVDEFRAGSLELFILDMSIWHPGIFIPDEGLFTNYAKWFRGETVSIAEVRTAAANLMNRGLVEPHSPFVNSHTAVRTVVRELRWSVLPDFMTGLMAGRVGIESANNDAESFPGRAADHPMIKMLGTLFLTEVELLYALVIQRPQNFVVGLPLSNIDLLLHGDAEEHGELYLWIRSYTELSRDGSSTPVFVGMLSGENVWRPVTSKYAEVLSILLSGYGIALQLEAAQMSKSSKDRGVGGSQLTALRHRLLAEVVDGVTRIDFRRGFRGVLEPATPPSILKRARWWWEDHFGVLGWREVNNPGAASFEQMLSRFFAE